MKLNGKVAAVTGAAQGIGAAIARRLYQDGARLALIDLDQAKAEAVARECSEAGREAIVVRCDVSNRASVFNAVDKIVEACGGLDIMVANAGICQVRSFLDLDESDWDRMLAVNVKGVVFSFQAAAKHMIASQRPGKLIAACSIAGHQGYAMLSHYCASKFAVRAIVQACAKELASYGIRVNAYCPGIVQTPMWEAMDAQYSQITGAQPGETLRRFARMALIKRAETPEDIVGLVSFLASDDSAAITGQSIAVDGGIVFL